MHQSGRFLKKIVVLSFIVVVIMNFRYYNKLHLKFNSSLNEPTNNTLFNASIITVKSNFCDCDIVILQPGARTRNGTFQSHCSEKASSFGGGQKVVSYSLYVQKNHKFAAGQPQAYYEGVIVNLKKIREYYKSWKMRLYTVFHLNVDFMKTLCELECNEDDFFLCNVENLTGIGNVSNTLYGMMWRFLPMTDPTVNVFLSRDLDSWIHQREKDAVMEWLNSNYTFHAMRDHPQHGTPILGGMWGAKNNLINPFVSQRFQNSMFTINKDKWKFRKGFDQFFLQNDIYPLIKPDLLVHDSYLCTRYKDSIPFPTERKDGLYVGGMKASTVNAKCPMKCRPAYGKNWTYC